MCLQCILIRFTHTHCLKQFQWVSLFYFHMGIQNTLTIFTLLDPLRSLSPSHCFLPLFGWITPCVVFLSFIFKYILMFKGFCYGISHIIYCALIKLTSSNSLPLSPCYSIAFSTLQMYLHTWMQCSSIIFLK
jgi:hypothetical protein